MLLVFSLNNRDDLIRTICFNDEMKFYEQISPFIFLQEFESLLFTGTRSSIKLECLNLK